MERDTSRVTITKAGPHANLNCSRSGGREGTRRMNSPIVYTQTSPVQLSQRTATLTTPTPTHTCPNPIPDAAGDFIYLFIFLILPSPPKGGGVGWGRAAAAEKIRSCRSSSSSSSSSSAHRVKQINIAKKSNALLTCRLAVF